MAFDIALTGLSAASVDLDVIANNIANSATTGFKESRAEFADIFAATNLGIGSNVGQGVQVTAVRQLFTQGDLKFTENNLDLAISGNGFFRINDNGVINYTRAGMFGVDANGYLVNAKGQRLTGYLADGNGNITGLLGDLQLSTAAQPPQATDLVTLAANLDATESIPPAFTVGPNGPDPATYNHSTSVTIYDSLGAPHVATLYYRLDATNQWESFLFVDNTQVAGPDVITFNPDGSLNQINGASVTQITTAPFNPGGGAANMTLTLDYAALTQYGSPFSVNSLSQNGSPTGRLSDIDIDKTGVIFARFSNGRSLALGQVALVSFANPQGLQPLGDTAWAETFDSGAPLVGTPGSGELGTVQSGALEESNVDITAELVALITAQRNFQANAQVISASDDITQTIINIR
ncbi:MAG: flagellar hook protein FlgE [Gammaproteobacteria bacterium]|nr:MAG: flagellar hook protein FlgE [Gammaproteobacteria bacterium]